MTDGASVTFVVEVYADWRDYPSWTELEDDENEEPPRFATVEAARAWLDAYLDVQDAKDLAWWHEREDKARRAREVHAKRLAVLEREGLASHDTDWQGGPLCRPVESLQKPKVRNRRLYRVAIDGVPCATCQGTGRPSASTPSGPSS